MLLEAEMSVQNAVAFARLVLDPKSRLGKIRFRSKPRSYQDLLILHPNCVFCSRVPSYPFSSSKAQAGGFELFKILQCIDDGLKIPRSRSGESPF